MNSNKGVSHKGDSKIAHAEAALGAGRAYEKSNEGHNQMFNDIKELSNHNQKQYGHLSNRASRGDRIDHELQDEDQKTIERMNQARQQKEEAKSHGRKSED